MSIYGFIVLIHIISAVCGLGAAFALPVLMKKPETVTQAKFAFKVNAGIEKIVKIGSITLLVTGLILGTLNPSLFTQVWYITSIIIFLMVQPVVAVILPKKLAELEKVLNSLNGEKLPDSYFQISKQMAPYNGFTHLAAIVLIILMVLKPF